MRAAGSALHSWLTLTAALTFRQLFAYDCPSTSILPNKGPYMKISETILPEFDQEMANTRKVLERVPEGKDDWKPHAKSSSLGALAAHIANMPDWAGLTLETDTFDYAPPGAAP